MGFELTFSHSYLALDPIAPAFMQRPHNIKRLASAGEKYFTYISDILSAPGSPLTL